ncbi:MAG: rpoC, partial [Alphaproteobacteria bacterium]|nr:rpoC [Alphaproteobacteria bacterium]
HKLELYGMASTVKAAKRMVEKQRPEVWDILEEVIREHPVLLNRAPTLHRLGIQGFEPTLIEGKAIQLHPLVTTAFNADFDGDQMAVHVPLSVEAQLEARVLMMSTNNILTPASGKPIIVPSQDIVLGLYYMTLEFDNMPGEGLVFGNIGEVELALEGGVVELHAKIKARYPTVDENGDTRIDIVDTTPGRYILAQLLPKDVNLPYATINKLLTKKEVTNVIDAVYRHTGQKEAVIFADRLMKIGFQNACRAGVSFGKSDMIIPDEKKELLAKAEIQVKEFEQQYMDGLITKGEKYNKVVDIWHTCTADVTNAAMKRISATSNGPDINSVWMMSNSGARGSVTQMRQLSGMRGLMSKPSGEIIESPIRSNFKEGLTVLEYFNSTHGARKGLADTALKTANSGYLTRRLCDVAMDLTIREEDCGTDRGVTIRAVLDGGTVVASLAERILGRTSVHEFKHPATGEVLIPANEIIDEVASEAIEESGVDEILAKSVLTCSSTNGICGKCYGRDLARGTTVNIGEAVGVIAAQSIGEPGTQLTMRTFHIGGAATGSGERANVEVPFDARVRVQNQNTLKNSEGVSIVMARNTELSLVDEKGKERARFRVPYGAKLLADEGAEVKKGQILAEWDPFTMPIITEVEGVVQYADLIDNVSVRENTDEATGIASRVVTDWRSQPKMAALRPRMALTDAKGNPQKLSSGLEAVYYMSVGAILSAQNGSTVKAGDIVARIPRETTKTRDITGGLPRVAELFEARRPKEAAIISEIEGRIEFGKDYKSKRRISIVPLDKEQETKEYLIPKGKHIIVQENDLVQKGDILVDGSPVPHEILAILGVEALANYLINEIQDVYRLQGVKINDKHIEVIVRQMMQKVEITDAGDTTMLVGEQVDKLDYDEENARTMEEGGMAAKSIPVLQGITKASLQTRSFISAASFQETTRVLTDAAVNGKVDTLDGLKENVIVGRLIPAGTGAYMHRIKRLAADRDRDSLPAPAAAETPALPDASSIAAE